MAPMLCISKQNTITWPYPVNAWSSSSHAGFTDCLQMADEVPPPPLCLMHLAHTAIERECINVILKWRFSRHCHIRQDRCSPASLPLHLAHD